VFTGYDYSSPNEIYNKSEPWRYLFLGCTEISYYTFGSFHSTGDPAGFFEPDMTLSPSGRWMSEALGEIMAGPSKLLHEKPRQHHGVAIYFSQNSIHGTTGLGIPVFVQLTRAQDALLQNLERFGLSPTVLASREVEANPECLRGFKVLFLPLCTSLSDTEIGAIEEFVKSGGVAFVDPLFGVQDEAGHWRPDRIPWFAPPRGDTLDATKEPQEVRGTVSLSVGGDDQSVTVASYRGVDRRLRDGDPAAGVRSERSEFFVERIRLGSGEICNVSFFVPSSEAMALWLRERVEQAGVTPAVVIRDADGRLADNVQVSHVQGEGKDYFGVVYGTRAGRVRRTPAIFTWPERAHTYDVQRGQYLGRVERWQTELDPVSPVLLCRLAKKIQDFSIDTSVEPGEPVKSLAVTIRHPAAAPRLLYQIRLEMPDGRKPIPLQQKVWAQPTATARFPIALNDPEGQWNVHVREAISGRAQTVECEIGE